MTFSQAVTGAINGVSKAALRAWPDCDWTMLGPVVDLTDPKTVYLTIDRAERSSLTVGRKEVILRVIVGRALPDSELTDARVYSSVEAAGSLIAEVETATDCGRAPTIVSVEWDVSTEGHSVVACTVETIVEEGTP